MELRISVLSRTGGRETNQDAYGVWSGPASCFCALSDGAGGHSGGAIASRLAVRQVLERFCETPDTSAEAIAAALKSANDAIVQEQHRQPRMSTMRATILALAFDTVHDTAAWGHVGDTRLYCFREGRIVLQTRDHSVVQTMVDAGYMEPQDARMAPGRSALLAALGDAAEFAPSIASAGFAIQDGDIFLLCTDGLWEHIEEAQMEQLLEMADSEEAWLQELENQVLRFEQKDQDNYSAIVVSCMSNNGAGAGEALQPPMAPPAGSAFAG